MSNVRNYEGDVHQSADVDSNGTVRVYLYYPESQATLALGNRKILTHIKTDELVISGHSYYPNNTERKLTVYEMLNILSNKVVLDGVFNFTERGTAEMEGGSVSLS